MDKEKSPSFWFFAEWLSLAALFLTCFVFLFNENKAQSARTDRLYEIVIDILRDGRK